MLLRHCSCGSDNSNMIGNEGQSAKAKVLLIVLVFKLESVNFNLT